MPVHKPPAEEIRHPVSTISTQALCYGPIETSVFGVTGSAARPGGRAHIGVKFGRVLIYLEDRTALEHLAGAVRQAVEMADAVFGQVQDSFAVAEFEDRRRFERAQVR